MATKKAASYETAQDLPCADIYFFDFIALLFFLLLCYREAV